MTRLRALTCFPSPLARRTSHRWAVVLYLRVTPSSPLRSGRAFRPVICTAMPSVIVTAEGDESTASAGNAKGEASGGGELSGEDEHALEAMVVEEASAVMRDRL